ncbi:MAG: hypothetical protein AAGU19_13600 [Prolixibacteraceae bacterium]
METKKLIKGTEVVVSAAIFAFIGYGLFLANAYGHERFLEYVKEDGTVENLTALFLFFCSMVSLFRVFEYRKMKKPMWVFTSAALTILFFFAAGEEISWGQRIFGIESSEFFLEHNKQAETNIHNLIVKGRNLNKFIFAAPLFVVLIIYFGFTRLMVKKLPFVHGLVRRFRVPLPQNQHIIVILIATLMVLAINMKKESELHEVSFAMIFFLILLNPLHAEEK